MRAPTYTESEIDVSQSTADEDKIMLYPNDGAVCSAVIGSMTAAMKAQRLLSGQALRATVKKISSDTRSRGCVYGIEFDCAIFPSVRRILESSNIDVTEYLR